MPRQPKPLKIGLVLDDGLDKPDGVQQYVLGIGTWLSAQGHDVHYLVGETKRTDLSGVHSLSRNIAVVSNGNRLSIPLPTSRRKLRQLLRDEAFDVLHVQTPFSPFMGGRLVQLAGKNTAVIGTFHILPNSRAISVGTWFLGLWSRRPLMRFDVMLSVSSAAAEFARKTFKIESTVVPNVIDYRQFHTARPLSQYRDSIATILFLGRLVPRKGSLLLVAAIAELAKRKNIPQFRVLICGRGPLDGQLRRMINLHGLEGVVEMVGFVSEQDKPRYYASADISVFPSSGGESFGIVLLEAMASGKAAVLAGDNPGYHTVMEPQSELLFDPHDANALADKIEALLTDEVLRKRESYWGEVYTKDFDVNKVGARLVSIYNEALHKRRGL